MECLRSFFRKYLRGLFVSDDLFEEIEPKFLINRCFSKIFVIPA